LVVETVYIELMMVASFSRRLTLVSGVYGKTLALGTLLAVAANLLLLRVGSESFRAACGGAGMVRGGD
jgi:hypothetical protein